VERPRCQAVAANRWVALSQLEAVRVFTAVAEFLSFREAALGLNLPCSTVYQVVKRSLGQQGAIHVELLHIHDVHHVFNMVRYFGVLSSHSSHRAEVVLDPGARRPRRRSRIQKT